MTKVLMVCLGNICRSPMAEGILIHKINQRNLAIEVDSAGTGNYHVGEHPDSRAIATAKKFGIDISGLIARQFTSIDFSIFDWILVMDSSNAKNVLELASSDEDKSKVKMFLEFSDRKDKNVPDPWFGNNNGFVDVFKMLEVACEGFLKSETNFIK